jgi:hypothetical protein
MAKADAPPTDIFAGVQKTPGHLLRRFQQIAVSMFLKECLGKSGRPLPGRSRVAPCVSVVVCAAAMRIVQHGAGREV